MVSATQFIFHKLIGFVGLSLFSLFSLFRFLFFRYIINDGIVEISIEKNQIESNLIESEIEKDHDDVEITECSEYTECTENNQIELNLTKLEIEKDVLKVIDHTDHTEYTELKDEDKEEKKETPFIFKFPTFEEFISKNKEHGDFVFSICESVNKIHPTVCMISEPKTSLIEETEKDSIFNPDDGEKHDIFSESTTFSEKDSLFTNSDSDSTTLDHVRSFTSHSQLIDSSDGFLSDGDFGGEFELDTSINGENSDSGEDWEREEFEDEDEDEEDSDVLEELEDIERDISDNSHNWDKDFLLEKDFKGGEQMNGPDQISEENVVISESGDANKLEALWEHQELIEQLKMELKKVKATGLPTILEDSESPKIMDDLKPWKIDEKFHREDCIGELHIIYKSYKERMRKFDILNYQKMYAIGFLQLKDPLQSITTTPKTSGSSLKSIVSQNFKLLKNKTQENEPMTKFIKELQNDLETVYVGQMCLSWEFLHWQYTKSLDLWGSDPRGVHQYNEVADEFQQFRVLINRFLEDEPLQGPRVQHYINSRCLLRNLLHVPVIREDGLKDKRRARKREKGEYAITSDILVEILEESIRIFWRFIGADKDSSIVAWKGHKETSVELQNPEDFELLVEIRKSLQQKERKLKEILKSEKCILRKFKKNREDDTDHVLYFFSQVDMRLVSRVLNMSRLTTEQLVWCLNKLSKISYVNRKIHVEPSFLLFPC